MLDGVPGVPAEPFGPLQLDVSCPECGIELSRGSQLVTGGHEIAAMHRGDARPRIRAIVARYGVTVAIILLLSWRGWSRATGIIGGLSMTWVLAFGVMCLALAWMLATDLRRWKRREDAPEERVGAAEIGWLINRSGLVVFKPGILRVGTALPSDSSAQRPTDPARMPRDRIESLVVQPIAPTALRRPPADVAVASVFRRRARAFAWLGPASLPEESVVVHLHGRPSEVVADRLAQGLEPLSSTSAEAGGFRAGNEGASDIPGTLPQDHGSHVPPCTFASAGAACPGCLAPAELPVEGSNRHPAWCTLADAWSCGRCRATLPRGAVVARGQSDGDVRGPGPINVLLEVAYLVLQIAAALLLVAAIIISIMLFVEFDWIAFAIAAPCAGVSIAMLLWIGLHGPIWRNPILRSNPCRARHTCDLVLCVTPGAVEIRRARGLRCARWRRHGWRRPAGLHLAHHPEGPLLISPFETSFRLWSFLPSDPRGYRSTELAEALRGAFGGGMQRAS